MLDEPTITITITRIQARAVTRRLAGLQREGDDATLAEVNEILVTELLKRPKTFPE